VYISSIPERIAARAAASPGALAVVDPHADMTYSQLMRQADQVAGHLLAAGVTSGQLVGVCLDRGASLVAALLGVLRAGCGYLPMDPDYPPDRLNFMLRDSGAAAVIGLPGYLASVPVGLVTTLDISEAGRREQTALRLPGISPQDLAYVIYTSGSTGTPKGVAVEHGQVARLFDAVEQRLPVGPDDTWSWCHSVAFDFSVWEMWGALTSGGRLVTVSRAEARDPAALLALLRDSRTTVLSQTPSAFHSLLTAIDQQRPSWSVRAVTLGGEAVSLGSVAGLLSAAPGNWPRLYNLYGITETTVHASFKELTSHDLSTGVRSPIGLPLADLRFAVLDQSQRPVSPGEQGELWVGGAGVARGYVGRPQLTARHFVTGLLPEYGQMRWYRSGDMVRQLPSGEFEYIGRMDRQVKLRGFRIELGEVEAAITAHPAVLAAAVELRGERLVAYLSAARRDSVSLEELRDWVSGRLPGHMIPSAFVFLEALPLTVNGKIDRDRLAQLPGTSLPRSLTGSQPRAGVESALHAIWVSVLGVSAIGRDDSFFAVGGDSMLALRVVTAAKAAGITLTVRDLFTHPTLAGLAAIAGGPAFRPPGGEQAVSESSEKAGGPAPAADLLIQASYLQRGMLLEAARDPDAGTYHVVSATRVTCAEKLSERNVSSALQRLAADNVALRTSFDLLHYQHPMQVIHCQPQVRLRYLDVSSVNGGEQERRVSEVFAEERARRFTEHEYPLWRVAFVQVAPKEAQVMLAHQHAILDGWSVACFFDHFCAALDGRTYRAAPPGVNEAAIRLEKEAVESPGDNAFWRVQAEAWTPLPVRRRSAAAEAGGVISAQAPIDSPLRAAIRGAAARWRCSPKHVYLAAHLRALALFARWDDRAATGLVINARPELAEAHSALGLFLNVVPLAVEGLGPSWAALAQAAMSAEARLQPHRWFPQAAMVAKFAMPPLNTCFNYTDFSATAMRGFLTRVTETSPNGMPLTISVLDDGLIAEADPRYFSGEECSELVRWHMDNLFAAVSESREPDRAGPPHPHPAPRLATVTIPGEQP